MGAYYDMIISPTGDHGDLGNIIGDFLSKRGLHPNVTTTLESEEINDFNAILLSPPANRWVEILTGAGIGIDSTWYASNPLAIYLSTRLHNSIHFWSLNSGHVAGYAIYANGKNAECECIFSRHATNTSELFDGVPTPPSRPGNLLNALLGVEDDYSHFMARYADDLELGMGELVGRIGFKVHLVDYFDATDDKHGIAIKDGKGEWVPLTGWTAILFGDAGQGCIHKAKVCRNSSSPGRGGSQ